MSHREFLTRLQWLDDQIDRPDRTDFYLMQIAAEIRRWKLKDPKSVQNSDFLLKRPEKKELILPKGSKRSSKMLDDSVAERKRQARIAVQLMADFGRKPSKKILEALHEGE